MAITLRYLPKNGYEAMQLINHLANEGHVEGVGYQIDNEEGKPTLKAIRVILKTRILVTPPQSQIIGDKNIIIPGGRN